MTTPADVIFTLPGVHVLEGPAIAPGWLCLQCGGYWKTVDEALAVPCGAGDAA